MIERDLLAAVSKEQIDTVLARWKGADSAVHRALHLGRELALSGDGRIDAIVLEGLARALESGSAAVVEIAALIAKVLVVRYPDASVLVATLRASKIVQGRLGALLCLSPVMKSELLTASLNGLISDESKRVREMTVDWIVRNNLQQYSYLLDAALGLETDSRLRGYIESELNLLVNGFHIDKARHDWYVTVQTSGGRFGGAFKSDKAAQLTDKQIADLFIKAS